MARASNWAATILAGLELFIVSDIIETALSLQLSDLVFLGCLSRSGRPSAISSNVK